MKADSIMVGDRKDDIYGAHNADIEAVGVRFGYAADGELEEAGADYIVNTVFELTALLLMDDDSVLCIHKPNTTTSVITPHPSVMY